MILIIAPRNDVHALCVAQDLEKMGKPFRFVDSSRLASEGRIQFRAGQHSGSTWTCIDGQPIALDDVDTVWHRRRFLPPVAARHPISDQQYFQREWTEMISGVFASLDQAWFVNDPERQKAAVKPLQLRLAERLGLRIPDTLITNDPVAAAAFIDRHEQRVVHKTLAAPTASLPPHEGMVGVRSRRAGPPGAFADDLPGDRHRLPRTADHRHRRSALRRRVPAGS